MYKQMVKSRKKLIAMFVVGLVFAVIFENYSSSTANVFITDSLFIIALVYFFCGLFELVDNMGTFNSLIFGSRLLYRLITSKMASSVETKNEYINYVSSKRKFGDVWVLMLAALAFFLASVLASFAGL